MMVFGIGLTVFGYAIFFWGFHHFQNPSSGAPSCRYSLWCLLGINTLFKSKAGQPPMQMPSSVPFQFK